MEQVRKLFERDRLARELGIELVDVAPGRAVCRMRVEERHLNGVDMTHGGAIFTLADFTFAVASNAHGRIAVALNGSISYLQATGAGDVLTATATELSLHKSVASYQVDICNEQGDRIAVFQGTVYRKQREIGEHRQNS